MSDDNSSGRRVIVRVRVRGDDANSSNQNSLPFNPYYSSTSPIQNFHVGQHYEDNNEEQELPTNTLLDNPSFRFLIGNSDHHPSAHGEEDEEEEAVTPQQQAKEFRWKLNCAWSGMIIFASFGLPLLVLCGMYFGYIRDGPTSLNDEQAMIFPSRYPCIIEKIWINCFVMKYTRACYYQVGFNSSTRISSTNTSSEYTTQPQLYIISMLTTPAYDVFQEPFRSLRVNDTVNCFTNRNETKVAIIEPSSELYEKYYMYAVLLAVFGSICCMFSLCSWVALFAKSR